MLYLTLFLIGFELTPGPESFQPSQFPPLSLCSPLECKWCCKGFLRESRAVSLSTFTSKMCPYIQSSPQPNWPVLLQTQLHWCPGSVPASPEDCWNIFCVKPQPGHIPFILDKGICRDKKFWLLIQTKKNLNTEKLSQSFHREKETAWSIFDYSTILLGFSLILSLWQQVITWHFLAQHVIVPNVISKIKQYTVVALPAGINISRG